MRLILAALAVACCVLYYVAKFVRSYYKAYQHLKVVPGPPRDNLILGHVKDLFLDPADFIEESRERLKLYGPIQKVFLITHPFVLVAGAQYAEVFFTNKHLQCKSELYRFMHFWLGQGLLTACGPRWQKSRKLLTPSFHFNILSRFCDAFTDNSLTLVEKVHEAGGVSIDVFKLMGLIALDNLCDTAMGVKIDALRDPKNLKYIIATEEATHTMMSRMFKPWLWNDSSFYMLSIGRKLRKDVDIVNKINHKIIEKRRIIRALKEKEEQSKSESEESQLDESFESTDSSSSTGKGKKNLIFLDQLIEAVEDGSFPFSEQDMRDEVATFMFEGHDTTTSALAFTVWLLGLHPECQEKCYQELYSIFQDSDRRPNMDDLSSMKYLEQCIKEGLRLFPSVPQLSREVPCDIPMGDYTLPAGTKFILSVFGLHRDPKYFPDPEKFDPERFTPENSKGRHAYAYAPFAAGARNCIGQKFAMMEMKIVISYLIRNFTFKSSYDQSELYVVFALILRSAKNLEMTFTPRRKHQNSLR
nr:PREDICTED: cytochrome P450 4C1-like [Bemisia tabaci]